MGITKQPALEGKGDVAESFYLRLADAMLEMGCLVTIKS